jgi:hypothetical protein
MFIACLSISSLRVDALFEESGTKSSFLVTYPVVIPSPVLLHRCCASEPKMEDLHHLM